MNASERLAEIEMTPVVLHLKNTIIQMDMVIVDLIKQTKDQLRQAELRTLQTILYAGIGWLKNDDFQSADECFHTVATRINLLMENPRHAGSHEKFRATYCN
jgi:hypothetical protein